MHCLLALLAQAKVRGARSSSAAWLSRDRFLDATKQPVRAVVEVADLDQAMVGPGFRRPDIEHFAHGTQLISRAYWARPAQFIAPGANQSARRPELAIDQKTHRGGRGIPAAGCQAMENRVARRVFIQMEGLRIDLAAKLAIC